MEQQYVVINIEKTQTISAVLERHILRVDIRYEDGKKIVQTWTPDNADASKAMLNRELVSRAYVDPLTGQTKMRTIDQAIRHRIEEAGIKKLSPGQNTALEIILTGSPETLNGLDEKGLEKWVDESIAWAGKTWGQENIVTAVLHRDEKTPHIHLIVVPIVQGLSRRTKARDEMLKRAGKEVKTKKRNTTGKRLSANEVYTQPRLYAYHTSYAKEVGAHFGLKRGVRAEKGSRKNPQKSIDFNRELERQRLETEAMIAEMRSEYSEKQEELQTVTESLAVAQENLQKVNDDTAIAQENLQKVNDDMAVAQANLQQIAEAADREEEKRKKAKKEADEEAARLQNLKRQTAAEKDRNEGMKYEGDCLRDDLLQVKEDLDKAHTHLLDVMAAAAQEEEKRKKAKREADGEDARLQVIRKDVKAEEDRQASLLEKGRDIEDQLSKRESFLKSLTSLDLWKSIRQIPENIREELTRMVRRYILADVVSFKEEDLVQKNGDKDKLLKMEVKWDKNGKVYDMDVLESDGRAWINRELCTYKNGDPVYMKEIAGYCSRTLTPEAKSLVASMYKRIEEAPVVQDPVLQVLKDRYGKIAIDAVTPLKTNGKETGRMYYFKSDGNRRTAVYDVESKEISISTGHVKPGTFYLSEWKTLSGKPAVGVSNRVVSREYRKRHMGRSI